MTKQYQKLRGFIHRHLLSKSDSHPKAPPKPRSHWKRIAEKQQAACNDFCISWCNHRRIDVGCPIANCPIAKHAEKKP